MTGNAQPRLQPQPEGRDARKYLRKRSLLPATLVTERGSAECRVLDLSAGGAKLECADGPAEGERLTVIIEAVGTFSGRVIWRRECYAGVKFEMGAGNMSGASSATVAALTPLATDPLKLPLVAETESGTPEPPELPAVTDFAIPMTSMVPEPIAKFENAAPVTRDAACASEHASAAEAPCLAAEKKHRRSRALKLKPKGEDVFTLSAGQPLFQEGDPGGRMYVVRAGRLRIQGGATNEEEEIGSGAIVGELEMLEKDLERRMTVVAVTECELMEIDARRFKLLIGERPDFAIEVMYALSGRLRHMSNLRIAEGAAASSRQQSTDRGTDPIAGPEDGKWNAG